MRTVLPLLIALFSAMPVSAQSPAPRPVEVEFVAPEGYTDARLDLSRRRQGADEVVIDGLRKHLERQGPRFLQAGQQLRIRVLDIDLAGDREPTANFDLHDVRIVRDVYPPRIRLQFDFTDSDGIGRGGEVKLVDPGFNMGSPNPSSDRLRYEKRMLTQWLRREFPPAS